MNSYLIWSGIIANVVLCALALLIVWAFLIWPLVEALSMTRWLMAISKHYPDVKPRNGWMHVVASHFDASGRRFYMTGCRYGRWDGVGKWTVFEGKE